ncbi:hypothetical protein DFH27DRAFT_640646 [Peziza echinospora]|nr:hypothetical protein DFH27DRAFT_640646 [Peziza echinospora]
MGQPGDMTGGQREREARFNIRTHSGGGQQRGAGQQQRRATHTHTRTHDCTRRSQTAVASGPSRRRPDKLIVLRAGRLLLVGGDRATCGKQANSFHLSRVEAEPRDCVMSEFLEVIISQTTSTRSLAAPPHHPPHCAHHPASHQSGQQATHICLAHAAAEAEAEIHVRTAKPLAAPTLVLLSIPAIQHGGGGDGDTVAAVGGPVLPPSTSLCLSGYCSPVARTSPARASKAPLRESQADARRPARRPRPFRLRPSVAPERAIQSPERKWGGPTEEDPRTPPTLHPSLHPHTSPTPIQT